MIASSSEARVRGKAFGIHRTLDTLGAIIGPTVTLLVLSVIGYSALSYRKIFLLALIPAVAAVLVLASFVKEPKFGRKSPEIVPLSFRSGLGSLSREFKIYLGIATLFALGNFSWAFLILRAVNIGISPEYTIMLFILHNIFYAFISTPAGMLSDRIGRRPVIILGYSLFGLTCVGFALASCFWHAVLLFALYGLFKGIYEGVQKAYTSDLVGPELRGTAMGALDTSVGLAAFPASLIAGLIWQFVSFEAAFIYGALLSLVAAILMAGILRRE
jgi:MFS family permease